MRDENRIPLLLSALERRWRRSPDQRLGQLLVNQLRMNTDTPAEAEGTRLFSVEDTTWLAWLEQEPPSG